jgi:cardiolipin synthase
VDVRILIPGIPDKKFVYYATLANATPLLKSGVRVYTHKGFVHAKTLVVDDRAAAIGTANFDNRSFQINYELATLVHDRDFAVSCRETFLKDLENATELSATRGQETGFFARIREGFWRLVGPLL